MIQDSRKIVFYQRKKKGITGDYYLFYRIGEELVRKYHKDVYCPNNGVNDFKTEYCDSGIHFCPLDSKNME